MLQRHPTKFTWHIDSNCWCVWKAVWVMEWFSKGNATTTWQLLPKVMIPGINFHMFQYSLELRYNLLPPPFFATFENQNGEMLNIIIMLRPTMIILFWICILFYIVTNIRKGKTTSDNISRNNKFFLPLAKGICEHLRSTSKCVLNFVKQKHKKINATKY